MKNFIYSTKKGSIAGTVVSLLALIIIVLVIVFVMRDKNTREVLNDSAEIISTESENVQSVMTFEKEVMMTEEKKEVSSDEVMEKTSVSLKAPARYENYEESKIGDADRVVLFFHASWCPTCRSLDVSLNKDLSALPTGVLVLKTDYDSETELKQKYGVTVQHTLVEVDAQGNMLNKWLGTTNASVLSQQIKA